MNQDIKFQIIDLLKRRGAYSASVNQKQHYTRCPYCGDSRTLSHAHMSIKIDVESDDPMVYRCLKCDAHGLVTEDVLEELDILVDKEMSTLIRSYNRKSVKMGKAVNLEFEKYNVPLYQENYFNSQKLKYVNDRLGLDLTYEDAKNHKIILNLFDFMKLNEIESIPGMKWGMLKLLNDNYVGFLSCNNNCITMRDITGKQKYRYFKMILNQKNLNADTFYSIPNGIPMMYTKDIHIHIAEGIFDILSIEQNVIKTTENNLFYASCGFGSMTIVKYLIHHGINTGLHLHIYSDNDKSEWDHKKYLQKDSYLMEWIDRVYMHRNLFEKEKDFGVPNNRIITGTKIIK